MSFKMVLLPPDVGDDWPEKIRQAVPGAAVLAFQEPQEAIDEIADADAAYGTVPPEGDREELPPWLVDGILEMEDVIKSYYERQGVGDLYEEQVPKK